MKYLFTLIFSLATTLTFAQKKQNVYYFKNNGKQVTIPDSADYVRIISESDSGSVFYNLIEKYKTDSIKKEGNILIKHLPLIIFDGQVKEYYMNGKISSSKTYTRGRLDGDAIFYSINGDTSIVGKFIINRGDSYLKANKIFNYKAQNILDEKANGVLSQSFNGEKIKINYKDGFRDGLCEQEILYTKTIIQEKYYKGKFLEGKKTDINGNETKYKELFNFPYCEGQSFMKSFGDDGIRPVSVNIKSNDLDGSVIYSFDIDRFGRLDNFKLMQSVSEYSDKKALDYIKKRQWHPASVRGQTYDTYGFIYIVTYHLD
jgi:antitoxin component YwqK of YwqJK toxin-antitoxin module